MKKRIVAILASFAMLLTCSALPASAEALPAEGEPTSPMEPLPPEEEYYSADGLIFTIYTPNQYTSTSRDKYAFVTGIEEGVTSVTIPAEADGVPVEGVLSGALRSVTLTEILVGEGQDNYTSVDGVLFNATGKRLEAYPLGKTGTYAVPKGTQYIDSCAFAAPEGYDGLTEITFPETLLEISNNAFENQGSLTEIVLPDSLEGVKENAFRNCKKVTTLHFGKLIKTFFKPCGGCTSLRKITGNPTYFHILDNVLYTNTGNMLALYPAGLTAEYYEIPSNTTGIMAGSFTDNPYLKEVEIPGTVDTVDDTFQNMAALETLNFPEGVSSIRAAGSNCPSLKTVYLPKTLSSTGYNFSTGVAGFLSKTPALTDVYYNGLESQFEKISNITYNNNIYRIGVTIHFSDEGDYETFFDGDEEHGGFTYKIYDDHAEVAGYTFGTKTKPGLKDALEVAGEVKGQPVTSVGRKAFKGFANVGELVLPDSIRFIKEMAFQGCLVQVNIPKHVESIGDSAFFGANLQTVTLPGTLERMGNYVFRQSHVREVIVEEGVTVIGECAFGDCSKLTSVKLPSTLKGIHGFAFSNTKALEAITLPYGLEWIGTRAFNGSGIRKINLPDTLTELNTYAFTNCEDLTSIAIPPQIKVIPEGAFAGSGLVDVTVPATVTAIEDSAFCNCWQLQRLTILNPECYIFDANDVICTAYDIPDIGPIEYGCDVPEPEPFIEYNLTIFGYEDSSAQRFAAAYKIPFEIYDPEAYEMTDLVAVQRYLLGEGTAVNRRDYDFNDDDTIDVFDLALLKRKLTAK